MAVGDKITATSYNDIQSVIGQVLGTGSGAFGYGQSLNSNQVSVNATVTTTQWRNLRLDILRARQHQTGTDLTGSLTYPTTDVRINESDRAAYAQMAYDASLDANRLAPPPANQATRENLVTTQTRTSNWNGTLTQTVTVNFADANAARYYFNTGSRFEFSASRTGGVGGAKDTSWTTLLSGMGTVYFNRSNTTCTGTGSTTSIGWLSLSASDQLVFSKDTSNTIYYPNQYRIYARAPSSSQIVFTIQWRDDSTAASQSQQGGGNPVYPQFAIDEDVTGTLTSIVQVYRASYGAVGDNVTVPTPPASTTSF